MNVRSGLKIIKEQAIFFVTFFIPSAPVNLADLVKPFHVFTKNSGKENHGKIDVVFKEKLSMQ